MLTGPAVLCGVLPVGAAVRVDLDLSLSTLLQFSVVLCAVAGAYAAGAARDEAQDKALAGLERALERERDERIAATARADRLLADSVATRAMWALGGRQRSRADTPTD